MRHPPPNIRTYGQLITLKKSSYSTGTCCACHKWGMPVWQLSTRAYICEECAKRKQDEVLGSIVKSERRARSWIKNHPNTRTQPQFISHVCGVPLDRVHELIAEVTS